MFLVTARRQPQNNDAKPSRSALPTELARNRSSKKRITECEAAVRLPELCEIHEQLVLLNSGL